MTSKRNLPRPPVEPYLWGFIGTFVVAVISVAGTFIGFSFTSAYPLAGGFFTGWLAGVLWNWAGRFNARRGR